MSLSKTISPFTTKLSLDSCHFAQIQEIRSVTNKLSRNVQPHIDFITPTIHFDTKVIPRKALVSHENKRSGAGLGPWGKSPWLPKASPIAKPIKNNLADCSNNVTPDCLRALYGIPALPPTMRTNVSKSYYLLLLFAPRLRLGYSAIFGQHGNTILLNVHVLTHTSLGIALELLVGVSHLIF